jgi:tetratricopeptide (TPR) repeat protein
LYAKQAQDMQNSLKDFVPADDKDKVFSFWALNDVATSLFIQGQAYLKAKKMDEAKEAFRTVATVYKFGQTWDPQGWFWKPSDAAKEKLAMIESGSDIDFGNFSSSFLTGQAWKALSNQGFDAVKIYVDKLAELYGEEAKKMQDSLVEYPWESKEKIMGYWALNDVGTAIFVQGEAFRKAGKVDEAKAAYKKLVVDYSFAQCWDPQGWFWKPAEEAQKALDDLGEKI